LIVLIGLVLLALTLYVSTLAYALPAHSRARLSGLLPEATREQRLAWLDRHEWELQTLTSFLRLGLSLAVLLVVFLWHTRVAGWTANVVTAVESGGITIVLLALFAIGIPHALAVHNGEAILARNFALLIVLCTVFWPFGRFSDGVEFVIRRLLGKAEVTEEVATERVEQEILDAVSEGEATGAVDEDKKEMIESVFALDETPVSAIMTPRTEINAVPADATYEAVRDVIVGSGHSRIPVYEGSIDHIIGVVYGKDLLRLQPGEPFDARKTMRTAPYVPETKTLDQLLSEFRATKVQIAIVLDEYGGTAGLATLEDILEELVGEIDDEYDQRPPPTMNRVDEATLDVDARVHVSEVNAELNAELPEDQDYETVGGFVFATLGKIPVAGEEFRHGNLRVRILDAEARRIRRLRIHVLRETAETA
jgi:CBS domain containing-hemolysin-like protein